MADIISYNDYNKIDVESNIPIELNNTPSNKYHLKATLNCISNSNLFKVYVWKLTNKPTPQNNNATVYPCR